MAEEAETTAIADEILCPVVATSRIISGKWTLLVLRDLHGAPKRFTELERSLEGISPRTLSQRLDMLEHEGIIARERFCEVPPRVEYRLTEKGMALSPIVEAMRAYGQRWLVEPECDDHSAGTA